MQEMWVRSQGLGNPLEEEGMATHSSILAWRIPWTEEPNGLQPHRVRKSWTQLSMRAHARAHTHTHTHTQAASGRQEQGGQTASAYDS